MAAHEATGGVAFDPSRPARLHPDVSLRAESFGALAYHFGTRRLVFVKSPTLVAVLEDLEHHASVLDAVAAHVDADEVARHVAAVSSLVASGVVDGR